jgi:hypothetical protein
MKNWKIFTCFTLVATFVLFASLAKIEAADTNTGGSAVASVSLPETNGGGAISGEAATFDLSPGTGAPPGVLCGEAMTPIPAGAPACTGVVPPSLGTPSGPLGISPWSSSRCLGTGWASWSHGYTGDVYYTDGALSQTITCPPGTTRLRFYVEPNPFTVQSFEVIADGVSSGVFSASGDAGATYVGICDDGGISNVTISCTTDFASGEFAWSGGVPTSCTDDVTLGYAGGTLSMNFTVGSTSAGTWNVYLSFHDTILSLLSIPLPAFDPPVVVPIALPFPTIGGIGILTTYTTAADGIICSDWDTVDTGP